MSIYFLKPFDSTEYKHSYFQTYFHKTSLQYLNRKSKSTFTNLSERRNRSRSARKIGRRFLVASFGHPNTFVRLKLGVISLGHSPVGPPREPEINGRLQCTRFSPIMQFIYRSPESLGEYRGRLESFAIDRAHGKSHSSHGRLLLACSEVLLRFP